MDAIHINPFLRWAGGKRWLVKQIDKYLPTHFNHYIEPFIGGGAIFFHLMNCPQTTTRNAFLSDSNEELINCYIQIRDNIEKIIDILSQYSNTSECYYAVREIIPKGNVARAARFLYLNQTSYNGIHRVNKSGKYNVPYGRRKGVLTNYCNIPKLRNISACLNKNITFSAGDFFENVVKYVKPKDLVFLDPPYTVAHENNGFIQYNQHIFSWEDQERLAKLLDYINNIEAYFIMTNAAHHSIADLFAPYGKQYKVQRSCNIGGTGAARTKVHEYIYTNFGGRHEV